MSADQKPNKDSPPRQTPKWFSVVCVFFGSAFALAVAEILVLQFLTEGPLKTAVSVFGTQFDLRTYGKLLFVAALIGGAAAGYVADRWVSLFIVWRAKRRVR